MTTRVMVLSVSWFKDVGTIIYLCGKPCMVLDVLGSVDIPLFLIPIKMIRLPRDFKLFSNFLPWATQVVFILSVRICLL
uniref:Uncharacterized protein n=1 Tax=Lepeophtheirus salmonis TaxID=72036 RepID=A0A0K2TM15_LEPSM